MAAVSSVYLSPKTEATYFYLIQINILKRQINSNLR